MPTEQPTPFLRWLTRTQRGRFLFINGFTAIELTALATNPIDGPWYAVLWCLVLIPLFLYWTGSYWYWRVKLDKGAKC